MSKLQVKRDIPYFSQWESPQLVEDIYSGKIKAAADPFWRNSGAQSIEEYELWSWNVCGMACLKMILASEFKQEFKTIKLARKCEKYGGFIAKENKIEGLYYKPMIGFLRQEFGLHVFSDFQLDLVRMKKEFRSGNYVIASVNSKIRDIKKFPSVETKGGHLALITCIDDDFVTIHNPSGYYGKSQSNYKLSARTFEKYFAERGIVVSAR